ncbi:regulatory protein RecX [Xylanibacter brevis]|uniref:regulatory protein RecX n=1 Tax=Xylanibacter brevis TaxID=83231 RepID=UPI000487D36A|nr:regulatory protein RecX [Xylanibacter brevis]
MAIKKETTGQQAYQKLTALCARSEHCQQEMIDKMRQWGVSPEEQAQVMERLVKERYVDDERFTRAFVNDKIRYNKWGRRKVEQALWMKRIDEHIAKAVLDEVDDEEYTAILTPMLKQKRRSTKANSDYELNMKLIKYALSRGFTMDIIKQCINVEDESEFLD